jgi:hypothetical protein
MHKFSWLMLVAVVAIHLSGCAQTRPQPKPAEYVPAPKRNLSPANAIAEAKSTITSRLKDPESARFSDVSYKTSPNARGEPTDVVCGMVNAKNSYGGYTGAKPFVYFVDRREPHMADGVGFDAELGGTIYKNFCAGGFNR